MTTNWGPKAQILGAASIAFLDPVNKSASPSLIKTTDKFSQDKAERSKFAALFNGNQHPRFTLEIAFDRLNIDISAILNIAPDHLERHGTMNAYLEAKKRIINRQF